MRCPFIGVVLVAVLVLVFSETGSRQAHGTEGMVASVHPLATDAGVEQLRHGGNAIDAAVAAALMLGVVDSHNSGIGGGCFVLLRRADGTVLAIDGRERAPATARRDMYVRDGKAKNELSQTGALAIAIPGALAAYEQVAQQFGKRPWKELVTPAADVAERGFALSRVNASAIRGSAEKLALFESSRQIFLRPDGSSPREGDVLKQPDLAATYREIAKHGGDWFYKGPFSRRTAEWMKQNGGLLTEPEWPRAVRQREPVVTTYRGYKIIGFPPPSSGGVHVAQMLNILEHFDLKRLHDNDPADFVHVIAEAMKLAFADRAYWLGDPDFVPVPRGLVSRPYAETLARRIDLKKAAQVSGHSEPPAATTDLFQKHTTHVTASDSDGNWVAITTTINTSFGSKVVIPGTGVVMNNQMDDFSIQPGVANAFGLVGAEANAIAPLKRPLSSMSPTIVLQNDRPILTVGAAGGPTIISQVVLALTRRLDLGLPLNEAIAAPRFHHQWSPDRLSVESKMPTAIVDELKRRGHEIQIRSGIGVSQGIERTADGEFRGVFDPRVPGKAAGVR